MTAQMRAPVFLKRGVHGFDMINLLKSILFAGKPLFFVKEPNSKYMQTHA